MSLKMPSLGSQGNVHQGFVIQQAGEHRNEVRLMIVPPQTELLHRHRDESVTNFCTFQLQHEQEARLTIRILHHRSHCVVTVRTRITGMSQRRDNLDSQKNLSLHVPKAFENLI